MLAFVVQLDLEIVQITVKTAFLHDNLKANITQSDEFRIVRKEDMVY